MSVYVVIGQNCKIYGIYKLKRTAKKRLSNIVEDDEVRIVLETLYI